MSVGGHPGEVFVMKCTEKIGGAVVLAGEGYVLELTGPQTRLDYFNVGTFYGVSFRPAANPAGSQPDDGPGESASSAS